MIQSYKSDDFILFYHRYSTISRTKFLPTQKNWCLELKKEKRKKYIIRSKISTIVRKNATRRSKQSSVISCKLRHSFARLQFTFKCPMKPRDRHNRYPGQSDYISNRGAVRETISRHDSTYRRIAALIARADWLANTRRIPIYIYLYIYIGERKEKLRTENCRYIIVPFLLVYTA